MTNLGRRVNQMCLQPLVESFHHTHDVLLLVLEDRGVPDERMEDGVTQVVLGVQLGLFIQQQVHHLHVKGQGRYR